MEIGGHRSLEEGEGQFGPWGDCDCEAFALTLMSQLELSLSKLSSPRDQRPPGSNSESLSEG